jgi:hypothetical protein
MDNRSEMILRLYLCACQSQVVDLIQWLHAHTRIKSVAECVSMYEAGKKQGTITTLIDNMRRYSMCSVLGMSTQSLIQTMTTDFASGLTFKGTNHSSKTFSRKVFLH